MEYGSVRLIRVHSITLFSPDTYRSMPWRNGLGTTVELLKQERPGNYPLYELTCSPLTSGLRPVSSAEADHPTRVAGTLVANRNYCTLGAEGKGNERALVLRSLDAWGNPFTYTQDDRGFKLISGGPDPADTSDDITN